MVKNFAKAFMFTVILFAIVFGALVYFEMKSYLKTQDAINDYSTNNLDLSILQKESKTQQSCNLTLSRIEIERNLLNKLSEDFQGNSDKLFFFSEANQRKTYSVYNLQMYQLLKDYARQCDSEYKTVLYFYEYNYKCPECSAQEKILDEIGKECTKFRIFGLPTNLNINTISYLQKKYNATTYPFTAIEKEKFIGLTSKEELKKYLNC